MSTIEDYKCYRTNLKNTALRKENERLRGIMQESSRELENLYSRLSILGAEKEKESHLRTIEYVGLTLLRKALQNKSER